MTRPARAFVALGANLGPAERTVRDALEELATLPSTRLVAASSLYRTAPVQAEGPPFINAVAALDTTLSPEALLDHLQALEQLHGRERPYHHAPRTLDLDLLLHGDAELISSRLTLPHPRLHQRAFVLVPLLELAPELSVAGLGRLADHLALIHDQPISRCP